MAGFMPAIHVFLATLKQDVDGRDKPGHDVERADARQFAVSRGCAMFKPDSRGSSPAMTAETEARPHPFDRQLLWCKSDITGAQ
jgi:hypothetical protein